MKRVLKISLAVFVLLWIPWPSTVVPKWKLKVSDVDGVPCVDQRVTQMWVHNSLEVWENLYNEVRFTDSEGFVQFPERTIWAPTIWRIVGPIVGALGSLVHAGGVGVSGNIYATGMIYEWAWLSYSPREPLPDSITVDECRAGDR